MTFHYDPDLDQLAVQLADQPSTVSEEIAPGFILDFDAEGSVVGFEIEHASRRMDLKHVDLGALPVEHLIWRKASTLAA